jgi:Isochorismatase family
MTKKTYQGTPGRLPQADSLDRSTLNSWEDRRVMNWVKETAKKKLVMAGLWTEVCLQMPVLSAWPMAMKSTF